VTAARLPTAIPDEVAALAADLPAGTLDDRFRAACERFDRYVGALALDLCARLAVPAGRPVTPAGLISERGWSGSGELALAWLLETLQAYGHAEGEGGAWVLGALPTPPAPPTALAAEAIAAVPEAAPAYRVLELCAGALADVLAGAASGEAVLFSPATMGLWFEYFSNANPHYALSNTVTAAALAAAAPPAATVVEVGGGGGSAAQACLAALAAAGKTPLRYHFTELHPAFLRRGARAAQAAAPAGCAVTAARLDINQDPAGQGLAPGGADAVVAVNTLHLATDLVAALARLRALLRPGGTLVVGELLRPSPLAGVHIELPFTLLEAFRTAPTDATMRRRPGFLAREGWERALAAAGFAAVAVTPAAWSRCIALYPGFYCAALAAH
jgi:SAM-dependent methyltransferase